MRGTTPVRGHPEAEAYEGKKCGDGVDDEDGGERGSCGGGEGELVGGVAGEEAICKHFISHARASSCFSNRCPTCTVSQPGRGTFGISFTIPEHAEVPSLKGAQRDCGDDRGRKGAQKEEHEGQEEYYGQRRGWPEHLCDAATMLPSSKRVWWWYQINNNNNSSWWCCRAGFVSSVLRAG